MRIIIDGMTRSEVTDIAEYFGKADQTYSHNYDPLVSESSKYSSLYQISLNMKNLFIKESIDNSITIWNDNARYVSYNIIEDSYIDITIE